MSDVGVPSDSVKLADITGPLETPVTYYSSGRFLLINFWTYFVFGALGFNLTYEVYLKSAASSGQYISLTSDLL